MVRKRHHLIPSTDIAQAMKFCSIRITGFHYSYFPFTVGTLIPSLFHMKITASVAKSLHNS